MPIVADKWSSKVFLHNMSAYQLVLKTWNCKHADIIQGKNIFCIEICYYVYVEVLEMYILWKINSKATRRNRVFRLE